MAASVWDFLSYAQMLMYAIAHGGCTDTVRASAQEADSGRKIPCRTGEVNPRHKLQALVYDILSSTTAVFSYAIGSRKLSANEQFFVGAQTVISLLQTT